jgi:hypothetical protein
LWVQKLRTYRLSSVTDECFVQSSMLKGLLSLFLLVFACFTIGFPSTLNSQPSNPLFQCNPSCDCPPQSFPLRLSPHLIFRPPSSFPSPITAISPPLRTTTCSSISADPASFSPSIARWSASVQKGPSHPSLESPSSTSTAPSSSIPLSARRKRSSIIGRGSRVSLQVI